MATYKTPGVYVEEITKFPPSVAQVETAIPAFIGYTEKATKDAAGDLEMIPTRITSMLEYETYFGFADKEQNIEVTITSDDSIIVENDTPSDYKMYYSMQMYFANGGGPCYICSVGYYDDSISIGTSSTGLTGGLAQIRKEDEPTLLLFPDAVSLASPDDFYAINGSALQQCNELQDRFTIIDTYGDNDTAIDSLRDGISLGKDYLKYGAAYYPYLQTILDYQYDDVDVAVENATSESSANNAQALSDSIVVSDLNTLLTNLIATRDLIVPGTNPVSSSNLENVRSQTRDIIRFVENTKAAMESIVEIGRNDGSTAEANTLDTWVGNNLDGIITSGNTIVETLNGTEVKTTIVNNLQENVTNFFDLLGATSAATGPGDFPFAATDLPAAIATEVAAVITDLTSGGTKNITALDALETTDSALYNRIKSAISNAPITLSPSSAMAGIYARVDSNVGVWKAPANVGVSYVVKPNVVVSSEDQESMNVDVVAGKSVNAIRTFRGKGTLVWGARTLAGNDNEWRYVPVRRFFNMVEESVSKATEQFVFESNDSNTWVRIRAMIENFLILQWKAGALAGSKPEQAFYVRVGLGQTMTAQDILEGRMIIEIGMAAVRPAEFIILRFSHKMQEA